MFVDKKNSNSALNC